MPAARRSSSSSSGTGKGRQGAPAKSATSRTRGAAQARTGPTASTTPGGARSAGSPTTSAGGTRRAAGAGSDGILSLAEQLGRGTVRPRDLVMLTRDRIQETLHEAAARGRVTRKDADELVAELVRRGRTESTDLFGELEALLERGRDQLQSATRAVGPAAAERLARGADRARRSVGVGPSFPIRGYDELTAVQARSRIRELKPSELRRVLTYERQHANRKSVVQAIERQLGK